MRLAHCLSALCLICCWSELRADDKPDLQKVLNDAKTLAGEGKYEEALQKHLWFHENALKQDPAFSGVRLSFALSYWSELGEKYPKAREAMVAIRDKNAKVVSGEGGSVLLFLEVARMNGYLKETTKTVDLFKTLHEKQPALAKQCYNIAEEDLAPNGEYKLCSSYLPDPLKRFDSIKDSREFLLKPPLPEDNDRLKDIADTRFVRDTCRLIEILVRTDRKQDAEKVCEQALKVRDDQTIRQAVDKAVERLKK